MSIFTVNGSPVKYDNKWLANGGTPSSELPPYDSSDAGKALVVNNEGDNVEWQTVGSSGTVDQHYDSTSSNAQSGTAVAEAISTKQDTISDLSDIRSGAEAGATAVQPSDLATVATTGNYNDLINTPTIPAAQVNSDWTAVSGVSQILNKPNLAAVATSGSYNDLSNKPNIPAAQIQSDWNQTNTQSADYIKNKPAIPAAVTVDQSYNASSTNPQSGTAVAGAIATVKQVPASTSADANKVLTVNSSGNAEWITPSGGGGGSVTPYPAVGTDTLRFEFVDPSIDPSSLNTAKVSWTHRTEDPNRNVWDATMLENVYADGLFKNVLTLSYKCRVIDGKVYSVNYSIESMFEGCRGLLSIDMTFTCDYGINYTNAAFKDCDYLEWIHISIDGTGRWEIVDSHFMCNGCGSLREIVWGYDVTSNPYYVYLTSEYDSVGNHSYAFQNCVRLKRIVGMYFASDSHHVLNIVNMFDSCHNLEQVPALRRISGATTTEGTAIYTSYASSAFYECKSLESIPPMVMLSSSYGNGMCSGCTSLVTVPLLVFTNPIGVSNMFIDCISLKTVEIQGSENFSNTTQMFRRCTSLTKLPVLNVASGCDCTSMYQDIPYANDNLTAAYNALSTSGATTYTDAFTDCGTLNTAGTAQRASIPASWGGDGT